MSYLHCLPIIACSLNMHKRFTCLTIIINVNNYDTKYLNKSDSNCKTVRVSFSLIFFIFNDKIEIIAVVCRNHN